MKVWDGTQWLTVVRPYGSVGPQGPQGVGASPTGPASGDLTGTFPNPGIGRVASGGLLAVQRNWGKGTAYKAFTGNADVTTGDGTDSRLQITYTPTIPVWWDVDASIGIMQKVDAAYHYCYGVLNLSPADADGATTRQVIDSQHSTVQTFVKRSVGTWWRLNAGVAYTCWVAVSPNAGSWSYQQRDDFLWMTGKVFAQ